MPGGGVYYMGRSCLLYVNIGYIATLREARGGNEPDPIEGAVICEKSGCDGITVARGALGTPWIFKDIENYLKTGAFAKSKNIADKKRTALEEHIRYVKKFKERSSEGNVGFMKKITMWYTKGFPDARSIRNKICKIKNYIQLSDFIKNLQKYSRRDGRRRAGVNIKN